ncbi:4972_t:CDS:2, partial [Dentiscutata erythropus]
MLKGKRKSYPVNLKLDTIEYAKKTNNHAAARFFNVDYTQISRWRVKEEEFKNARKTSHRIGSGASSLYPLAENSLKEWIFKLSYSNTLNIFKASDPWLNLFMNRFNLSLRRCTKTFQKLPKDLHEKVTEFHGFINELRINNNFELNCIANMDETSVYFDMVGAYTINDRVLADGSKLPLKIIFKGKRVPRGQYPPGIVIRIQKNGWMDEELMKEWLEAVWKQRP